VSVVVTRSEESFSPVPKHQLDILRRMNVPIDQADRVNSITTPDLIVDGIIGYSLQGAPRGPARELILWANGQDAPILALDAPSGLDTSAGAIHDPAIKATATMTLALPKDGLRGPGSWQQVGELYLADIGVPPSLYARPPLSIAVGNIFAESDIVRLS
jgi:NAD(P)H-hydrate epimerase